MGVSIAAYGAGMFHLMTHAFFKALMFMAAGSVIAAMAGEQNIDRMSGLRRAMPFTFAAFLVAALALGAFPGFSGYFSKDEILAFAAERGGAYWILYVAGTLGALMTAFYAFRMVFRVFGGEPHARRRASSSRATSHHAEPVNPITGEREDTDVGYPGPEHHIAERERVDGGRRWRSWPCCRCSAGVLQIPGVTHVVEGFLDPTFEDSRFVDVEVSGGIEVLALVVGAAASLAGHRARLGACTCAARARRVELARAAAAGCTRFLEHKWYFDELYDLLDRAAAAGARRRARRTSSSAS